MLLVGRLVYEKGFHLALDALAEVHPAARATCASSSPAPAPRRPSSGGRRASSGCSRHGTFLGWVGDDRLHALYRVADLCIVPSIYEPFGLVALEAMASGCLCVVADTGGLREVVPEDGIAGRRFPARDAEALAEILDQVLSDDAGRRQLVAEAREHVLQFDWDEVARRTVGGLRVAGRGLRRALPAVRP